MMADLFLDSKSMFTANHMRFHPRVSCQSAGRAPSHLDKKNKEKNKNKLHNKMKALQRLCAKQNTQWQLTQLDFSQVKLFHSPTCLWVALVLTGIQEASSTQFANPGPTGILLVVQ